jgi:aspartate racemase
MRDAVAKKEFHVMTTSPTTYHPTNHAGHIGIVAGSSEGAALCYQTICLEGATYLGRHAHPEVSLHHHSFADYLANMDRGNWKGVADMMLSSAEKLAKIGADFLICPDNSFHLAWAELEPRSPLPWLHIADEVTAEARRQGRKRVGLTGARDTMQGAMYPDKLRAAGIECVIPRAEQRVRIDRIIIDELVCGNYTPAALRYFQEVIADLKTQGCDAVVLGCTEIPILVKPQDSALPTLDSTRLLALAALRRAVARKQSAA